MKYYDYDTDEETTEEVVTTEEYGCPFCWDKRTRRERELSYFDHANNLRICRYCPNCGRKYEAVDY